MTFEPRPTSVESECALGDALTMIPPATGNGMSIALESAELAIEPLERYHRGDLTWENCRQTIRDDCQRRFEPRLRFAARLHSLLLRPRRQRLLLEVSRVFPVTLRYLFAHTR
jgi:2-polyprenyl-6-methoxyphenol hydroxylase-like FAD-dependent oxidoreductase